MWAKMKENTRKKNNHLKQQHLKKWINKVSNTTKNITSLSNVLFAAAMQMKKYFIHLREPFVFPVWFLFIQMISRSVFLLSGRFVCVLFCFFFCCCCFLVDFFVWFVYFSGNSFWLLNIRLTVECIIRSVLTKLFGIQPFYRFKSQTLSKHSVCKQSTEEILIDYCVR